MRFSANTILRLFFSLLLMASLHAKAQHTLLDDDVVVTDGVIVSCSYDFAETAIIIPGTLDGQEVTSIEGTSTYAGAFRGKGITSVVFPSSLTRIGTYSFYENDISSLDFSACAHLESIGETAFRRNELTHVDLSACTKLALIQKNAFGSNDFASGFQLPVNTTYAALGWMDSNGNLYVGGDWVTDMLVTYRIPIPYTLVDDDVVLTDGIIESCSYTFHQTDIIIPETLDGQTVKGIAGNASYSKGVFYNKDISSLVLPQSIELIGENAFNQNLIDEIDFSGMVHLELIEKSAFEDNAIASVSFSGCTSLRKIGTSAFRDNQLEDVDLTACTSLNWLNDYVFLGNSSLTGIELPTNSSFGFAGWQDSKGPVYAGGVTAPRDIGALRAIIPYTLRDGDVVVTDGIIESCSYDFSASLITIPDVLDGQQITGVTEASPGASYGDPPVGVFIGKGLLALNLPAHIDSIGNNVFSYNILRDVDFSGCASLAYIGEYAFEENMLTSLDLSACSSLHTIDRYAFQENKIVSLDLTNCSELVNIGLSAFQMNELTSLDLSSCSSLANIDQGAFYRNSIGSLDLSACVNLYFIGKDAFSYNSFSEFILPVLTVPGFLGWRDSNSAVHQGGETVTNLRMSYSAMASYVLKDEDVVMNNGVLESCSYDFTFTDIIIPEILDGQSVVKIGDSYSSGSGLRQGVFAYKGITSVAFPETLDSIGTSAFAMNDIEKLDLRGSNISFVGIKAFEAYSIDTILFSNSASLKTIEHSAFYGNPLELIDLENCSSLDTLRVNVFKNSGQLKSVNLSGCSSLCYIHEDAFSGAGSSLSIQLPTFSSGINYGWIDGNDVSYSYGELVSDFTILYRIPVVYTLTDDDVVVLDGFIESCSYDFRYSDIIIPTQLDGQEVRGIESGYSKGIFQAKGITSIEFPSSLDSIGDIAFYDNKLVSLDLSGVNPIYIGVSAFKGNNLSSVSFENCSSLRNIASEAFFENRIASLDLSACIALEVIGENAFRENEISSVDFNNCNSLVRIGINSFKVNKLVSIDLSVCPVLQVLEHGCFSNNDFESFDFSGVEHLTYIGSYVFQNNDFTSFNLPSHSESSLDWIDEESNTYAQSSTVDDLLIAYRLPIVYTLRDEDVVVVNGVIWKVLYDFLLTDIVIPNILNEQTIVGILDGVSGLYSSSGVFMGKGITSVQLPEGIEFLGVNAFRYNSIDSVDLSVCSDLKIIGSGAFKNNSLIKITWADGIESIGSWAFTNNLLASIDISALTKLIYIGGSAFDNNEFSQFIIPRPYIDNFSYWEGDNTVAYGNDVVWNLVSYYKAVFDGEEFSAVFTVSNGTDPLEGASITISGEEFFTDAEGKLTVSGLPVGTWTYKVTFYGYEDYESTLYIVDEDIDEDIVLTLTGIERRSNLSISIYPNPAREFLHVKFPEGEAAMVLELIDIRGQVVCQFTKVESSELRFDLCDYSSGLYIVRVKMSGGGTIVRRVVVE